MCFGISWSPVPTAAARFVRGLQFRPRTRAVHHANIRVDATSASRQLDASDPSPGYEGLIARSADFPDGHFLGWTPGQLAPARTGESWPLPAGSDLVVQLHLRPTGAIEKIAPVIGLYFGDRGSAIAPLMIRLGRQDLDIPPGAAAHSVTDSFTLPVAASALAIQAHAHYRARSVEAWATLPDGSRRPLLRIDDWDVNWQDRYAYEQPLALPAGTRLTSTYLFDNSIGNPRNPDRPPLRSRWGWRTSDEMGDVWVQVRTTSESDRLRLRNEVTRKMLTEDAIGSEVLLQREPDHVHLRNDAAQIYLALGQPARALPHFEAARTLDRASAAAWFNEGTALDAMGRPDGAAARYQEALRLNPWYSPALNNSGVLLLKGGHIVDARSAFERAAAADASNADAYANLGLTIIAAGESDAGLARVERALALKPELLGGMTAHAILLAAHADATSRRAGAALALAERIVRVSTEQAAALDALAVCQAALGDFDRAVRTAGTALALRHAPTNACSSRRNPRANCALSQPTACTCCRDELRRRRRGVPIQHLCPRADTARNVNRRLTRALGVAFVLLISVRPAGAQSISVTLLPGAVAFTLANNRATNTGSTPLTVTTSWTLLLPGRTVSVYGATFRARPPRLHTRPEPTPSTFPPRALKPALTARRTCPSIRPSLSARRAPAGFWPRK